METALVLSGGGAKGAFQAGVIAALHDHEVDFQQVAGVSVGVLNGMMVASGRIPRMIEIWQRIKQQQVYHKRSIPWLGLQFAAFKIGLSKPPKALYSHAPLLQLIKNELKDFQLKLPLTIGRVELENGDYIDAIHPNSPVFPRELLASTSIPVIWPPVVINGKPFVDGSVRNITPLQDVVRSNPDRIVVVINRPIQKIYNPKSVDSIIDIAKRSLDILLDEIFINDLRRCIQINQLVKQAEEQGVTLKSDDGRPLHHFKLVIIEPPEPLGDALNFDRDRLDKLLQMGREAGATAVQVNFRND